MVWVPSERIVKLTVDVAVGHHADPHRRAAEYPPPDRRIGRGEDGAAGAALDVSMPTASPAPAGVAAQRDVDVRAVPRAGLLAAGRQRDGRARSRR